MKRYRVAWSGSPIVGTGLSTFHSKPDSSVGEADELLAFFEAIKTTIPSGVSISVPGSGDIVEDTTGALEGAWTDPGTGGTVTCTGSGGFVLGVGLRVRWVTNGIYRGRRVRGTTFLAPAVSSVFDGSNAIFEASRTFFQTAADDLIAAAPTLCIWSRPTGASPGESNLVTSAQIPDQVSWLRSRRT